MVEIVIAIIIVSTASYVLYRNIKNKSKGNCNCGSCSSHCPLYDENNK